MESEDSDNVTDIELETIKVEVSEDSFYAEEIGCIYAEEVKQETLLEDSGSDDEVFADVLVQQLQSALTHEPLINIKEPDKRPKRIRNRNGSVRKKYKENELVENGPHVCVVCKKLFASKETLRQHLLKHCRDKQCGVCKKKFGQQGHLIRHIRSVHMKETKTYSCEFCRKRFCRTDTLNRHILVHKEKKYECPICYKKFALESYLKQHIDVHSGNRYECNLCGKRYRFLRNLNAHYEIIHENKKNKCDVCKRVFMRREQLDCHSKIHRIHTLPQHDLFECGFCGQLFVQKTTLKKHVLEHLCSSLFACKFCEKKYTSKYGLNAHVLRNKCQKQMI